MSICVCEIHEPDDGCVVIHDVYKCPMCELYRTLSDRDDRIRDLEYELSDAKSSISKLEEAHSRMDDRIAVLESEPGVQPE